ANDVGALVLVPALVPEREERGVRHDRVRPGEAGGEAVRLGEIGLTQLDAARGELRHPVRVAHHPDHVRPPPEQHVDDVAPEKARGPGDRDTCAAQFHVRPQASLGGAGLTRSRPKVREKTVAICSGVHRPSWKSVCTGAGSFMSAMMPPMTEKTCPLA